jgi:hypothetical protein
LNIYEHLLLRTDWSESGAARAPTAYASGVLRLAPAVPAEDHGGGGRGGVRELPASSAVASPLPQVPPRFLNYYNSLETKERSSLQSRRTPRKPATLPPAIGAHSARVRHVLTKEPYYSDILFAKTVDMPCYDDSGNYDDATGESFRIYPWLMQLIPARLRGPSHVIYEWSKRALAIFYQVVFVLWSIMFVWAVNVDTMVWPEHVAAWPEPPFKDPNPTSGTWRGSGHNLFMKPRAQERLGRAFQNALYLPHVSSSLCQAITGGEMKDCLSSVAAPHPLVDPDMMPGMSGQESNMTTLFPLAQPSIWAGPLYHRLLGLISALIVMSIYYKARRKPILRDKLMAGWIASITILEVLLLRGIRAPIVVVLPHAMRLLLLVIMSYFSFMVLSPDEYQKRRNIIGRILAFGGIMVALPCQTYVLKQIMDPATHAALPELTVFASFSLADRLFAHFAGVRLFVPIGVQSNLKRLLQNFTLFGTACLVATGFQVVVRRGKAADMFILFPAVVGPFIAVTLLGEIMVYFRLHRRLFLQSLVGMEWESHKDSLL